MRESLMAARDGLVALDGDTATDGDGRAYVPFVAFPDVLTTSQAAQALATNTNTVRRLIADGELRAVRLGRVWRVPKTALLDFCEGAPMGPARDRDLLAGGRGHGRGAGHGGAVAGNFTAERMAGGGAR